MVTCVTEKPANPHGYSEGASVFRNYLGAWMRKEIAVTCLLLLCVAAGCRKTAPAPEFKIPAEDSRRENPVKPTAASLIDASEAYRKSDCSVCHGKLGDGKGFMSAASRYACRDWRDPNALKNYTDGDLFYILTKGKGYMPGYEHKLTADQSWGMVNYVRAFATPRQQ